MIEFLCPRCSYPHVADDSDAGVKIHCADCGPRLQIPSPPAILNKTRLGEFLPPVEVLPVNDVDRARQRRKRFQCPACGSRKRPLVRSFMGEGSLFVSIVCAIFFWPLLFLGLALQEKWQVCAECGKKVREIKG